MEFISAPVSLLVLTSKEDEAESVFKTLRNGGLAVHGVHSDNLLILDDLVSRHKIELILCCEYDPNIDLDDCLEVYRELEDDAPLVVIAKSGTDATARVEAMRNGARDIVEHGDQAHLQLVVTRELSDVRGRQLAKDIRERLEECEQRSKLAMNASDEAVAFIHEGMHVQANPVYCELFGFDSEEDLVGYTLLDLVTADAQKELRSSLRSLNARKDSASIILDVACMQADESRFDAKMTLSKSSLDGEPCIRAMVQKADSAHAAAAPQLKDLDTGLPNFTALLDELTKRLDNKDPGTERIGIIYVGVSVYAKILQNESLSKSLKAMSAFGSSLHEIAPGGAFVARINDNGFAILLNDARDRYLFEVSSNIVDKARLPAGLRSIKEGEKICNTGAVLAEPGKDLATDIMNAAYRDYLFGIMETDGSREGSQLSQSTQALPESAYPSELSDEEQLFAAQINRALTGEGFQLVYQPIVSLKGDNQENYNVFVRLRDDQKRLREAKDFLSTAVRSGRMVSVDRWIIDHAIEELAKQREQNRKINFFVNLAEETLQEEKLLIWICDQLSRCQVRGNWLTFQIMEDHARRHSVAFSKFQEGLERVKCRVALNRFGQGPSPEVLLRNLHADFIKFAPELGNGLADDDAKQKRLLQLTSVAQELEMRTVVTGVEDARTLTVLWSAGVDYVQGNFLQKPSPTIEPPQQ